MLWPLLIACSWITPSEFEDRLERDVDGDGLAASVDCDNFDDQVGGPTAWFPDGDSDGHGATPALEACTAPDGYVAASGDCDDRSDAVHPDAQEVCNDVDDDCDGRVDADAVDALAWYDDTDSDGYGAPETEGLRCQQIVGTVADGTDCDDADPTIHPGARESCNEIDQDCDGVTNEAPPWWPDEDIDGFGDPDGETVEACEAPSATADNADDCDDSAGDTWPGAPETCDGQDQDCDGLIDEAAWDAVDFYADGDGDGFGDPTTREQACTAPEGLIEAGGDCDDDDPAVHPEAAEVWYDGVDDDCDGGGNDDDADGDGHPASHRGGQDCDDENPFVNPDMEEACGDFIDNDCDYVEAGLCSISGETALADAHATFLAESSGDEIGHALAMVGDVTGDGQADLAIGGRYVAAKRALYLSSGPVTGSVDLGTASVIITNGDNNWGFGQSIAPAHDLDGDGQDDLVAQYNGGSSGKGDVFALLGPLTASQVAYTLDLEIRGEEYYDELGHDLGRAGDVDGDGVTDLLLGTPHHNADERSAGLSYVFTGPLSGVLLAGDDEETVFVGETQGDGSGHAASFVQDLDGDGLDDVVIGAPQLYAYTEDRGFVYVITTPLSGSVSLADADHKLTGADTDDNLGSDLDGGADFDGDGLADLLLGAPGAEGEYGAVYLVPGSAVATDSVSALATATLVGVDAYGATGASTALAGDVNGDTRPDVLVGAYAYSSRYSTEGEAYLVYGPLSGSVSLDAADVVFESEGEGDRAGTMVTGDGDLDSDGLDDVVIGAPFAEDATGGNGGRAYLFYGG